MEIQKAGITCADHTEQGSAGVQTQDPPMSETSDALPLSLCPSLLAVPPRLGPSPLLS